MKVGLLELVVILMAPLVVLSITAFVFILMFVVRRTGPVSKIAPEPKIEFCPNCSHRLVEVRNFCAQCGASIRNGPRPRLASPETPS